jgi:hypothetical protein
MRTLTYALLIHSDGGLDGHIITQGERFHLEPAHRYFDDNQGAAILFRTSDLHIRAEDYGPMCGVSQATASRRIIEPVHIPSQPRSTCYHPSLLVGDSQTPFLLVYYEVDILWIGQQLKHSALLVVFVVVCARGLSRFCLRS